MPHLTLIIASIIQGITEFLPVSSSAHLFIWEHLQGVPPGGFPYEMILNAGSLFATIVYFRAELFLMARDTLKQCAGKGASPYSRLAWLLILSTIPVCLVGFFFHHFIESSLRSIALMGGMMMIFGFILGLADRQVQSTTTLNEISWAQAFWVGIAQIFSLIPGASRSGTTITAARFCGLNREIAVRYSFLLSIPVLGAAITLELIKAFKQGLAYDGFSIGLGFGITTIVSLLCIHALLSLITRIGFLPFAIYRLILGAGLLYFFW